MKTRRQFFGNILGAVGFGVIFLKSGWAHAKKMALKLDKIAALKKVGGSAKIKLKGQEILLVRDTQSSVKAVSPICSHQKCPVAYNAKTGKIDCSCHGSKFELTGKVLNGPATKPLKTFAATLSDGRIVISVD